MFIFLQESPADKAGIETRDVITHINGVEIFDTGNVYELLETPEDLHVTLIRDNIQKLVTVRPDFWRNPKKCIILSILYLLLIYFLNFWKN